MSPGNWIIIISQLRSSVDFFNKFAEGDLILTLLIAKFISENEYGVPVFPYIYIFYRFIKTIFFFHP